MYFEIITVQCSVISKDYINYLGIPYDDRAISPTVFMLSIAINRAKHLLQLNFSYISRTTQETMEALGGLDIMPTHLDACRCRHV